MTQPEVKPSPPFGMEVCPASGAYVLQGWPIRRVPALSPEDLEVLKKVRNSLTGICKPNWHTITYDDGKPKKRKGAKRARGDR